MLTTPLLSLLRKNFPSAKISIGIGDWAMPLLENNPHVDEIMPCNGPWHNKQICNYPANSIKTYLIKNWSEESIWYQRLCRRT